MKQSDEALIAAYLGGEEEKFGELVERHLGLVYSLCARLAGREEADDIAQEVFLKVWKHIKKYDRAKSTFKTWLVRIARNAAVDALRKKKIPVFSDFEIQGDNPLAESLADPSPLPEQAFAAASDRAALKAALRQLSPAYRDVVVRYYRQNLTFEALGATLRMSPNTVKSRHRRAIRALQKILARSSDLAPSGA